MRTRFTVSVLTSLALVACQDAVLPNAEQVQFRMGNKSNRPHWVADYFTPLVPAFYGIRTYESMGGEDGLLKSQIIGTETVPYQSGAITGVRVLLDFGFSSIELVLHAERKSAWWLNTNDFGGKYFISTNCELEAYPSEKIFGRFYDGTILDNSGTYYAVAADASDCQEVVTPAPNGGLDSWVWLMQIRDVRIGGKRYNNALIMWELEPELPFVPLEFHGKDQEIGITLPTETDTDNSAIDDLVILGFHKGLIAIGDVGRADGELKDFSELVSVVRP